MTTAISVQQVNKRFRTFVSRKARILSWLGSKNPNLSRNHDVLNNIDFEVPAGQSLGLIGLNGAGKSTLLKILAGTLHPTSGRVLVNGSVAALLELGTGFNPELSGLDNLHFTLALMGFAKKDHDRLVGEIADFAQLESALHNPLRTYSSGMAMRLAFSMATCVRPNVLIIDEALSVGDAHFQHKSFRRIRQFKEEGTTLLLVSHDRSAIQSICDRALLLNHGRIEMDGSPAAVFDKYNALLPQAVGEPGKQAPPSAETCAELLADFNNFGNNKAVVLASHMHAATRSAAGNSFFSGEMVILKYQVVVRANLERLVLGFLIKNRLGQDMFGTNTHHYDLAVSNTQQGDRFEFDIQFALNLGPGHYSITVALTAGEDHLEENYFWKDLDLLFEVTNPMQPYFVGYTCLSPTIAIKRAQQ